MRKLASIKIIDNIQPIEGADMIELASVGGWNVVVAKDVGHKVGDMVIYCEIDSFLPIREEFEFLRKSSYKKMGDQEGFRLKTIKLRGQISQGLVLPISVLGGPDEMKIGISKQPWGDQLQLGPYDNALVIEEGLDVTEVLGIQKYDPLVPAQLVGKVKGQFPSFLRRTDEERVQNLSKEYEEWKFQSSHQFYVTEKLDGSSATFYYKDGAFGVCSRNLELLETDDNTYWKVAREMKIEERLRELGRNLSIQGELIGEGIQGNRYKIKGHTVRFFNVFDIDKFQRLGLRDLIHIIENVLGFQTVPILSTSYMLPSTVAELLEYAESKSVLNETAEREGIVIRSIDNTISFKAISNKFLLKSE